MKKFFFSFFLFFFSWASSFAQTSLEMKDLFNNEGLCGKRTGESLGINELLGTSIDTCELFNSTKGGFVCAKTSTFRILSSQDGAIKREVSCDSKVSIDKNLINRLLNKLNSETSQDAQLPLSAGEDAVDESLLHFMAIKECKEETNPEMLQAGRCYTDKVDYVNHYASLLSMISVSLLGLILPSHCVDQFQLADYDFEGRENHVYPDGRIDLKVFAISSSNYLNSEQLAYQEYQMYANEIQQFTPYALEYFTNRTEYPEFAATETEKQVTDYYLAGSACQQISIGDQIKSLIQSKMNYISMIDLIDKKALSYNAARNGLYDAASLAHAVGSYLDQEWFKCEEQLARATASCTQMGLTGLSLISNPFTISAAMAMIFESTRGLTYTGLINREIGLYFKRMNEHAGSSPSNGVFNQMVALAAYYPLQDQWKKLLNSDSDTLGTILHRSREKVSCFGATRILEECIYASVDEASSITACSPPAMACKALSILPEKIANPDIPERIRMAPEREGGITKPKLFVPGSEVPSQYQNSSSSFFTPEDEKIFFENNIDLQTEFKKIAKYLALNIPSNKIGEILNEVLFEMRNNALSINGKEFFLKNISLINTAQAQVLGVDKIAYQKSLWSQAKNLKERLAGVVDPASGAVRYASILSGLESMMKKLQASELSSSELLLISDQLVGIQNQTLTNVSFLGRASQNLFSPVKANFNSPIPCDNIPAIEFKSCIKDGEISKNLFKEKMNVATQTVSFCSLYDSSLNRFFCDTGKSMQKNVQLSPVGLPVSATREISIACIDDESNLLSSLQSGKGVDQAIYNVEMSCILSEMNKKIRQQGLGPLRSGINASSIAGMFSIVADAKDEKFDAEKQCGVKDIGMQLKDPFGLWDDAIYSLRGDQDKSKNPLVFLTAREGDKALASPRFRMVLFEVLAEEMVVINVLLDEMRAALLSNIENINKILRNTKIQAEHIAECEEAVIAKQSTQETIKPIMLKTVPKLAATQSRPNDSCPVGKLRDGSCPDGVSISNVVNKALQNAFPNSNFNSSLIQRVKAQTEISDAYNKGAVSGQLWNATETLSKMPPAKQDLDAIKAYRNQMDASNGFAKTDYNGLVRSAQIYAKEILTPQNLGNENKTSPKRSRSLSSARPRQVPGNALEFVELEAPDPNEEYYWEGEEDDDDAFFQGINLDLGYNKRTIRKEEAQVFKHSPIGKKETSLFDMISNRYMKTGLLRLGQLER